MTNSVYILLIALISWICLPASAEQLLKNSAELKVEYAADMRGNLTYQDVLSKPSFFKSLAERTWQWNVHTHWYRVPLRNDSNEVVNWVLSCGISKPPLLNAYWKGSHSEHTLQVGDGLYASHTNISFPISLQPGEEGYIYLQYQSVANFPLILYLIDQQTFIDRSQIYTLVNGIALGAGFVLFLFIAQHFFIRPNLSLGFYCLFIISMLLFMMHIFGYTRFLNPHYSGSNPQTYSLLAGFIYVFYFLFIAHSFSFKQKNPYFYRTLILISSILALLTLSGLPGPTDVLLTILVVIGLPLPIYGAIRATLRHEPGARFLLIGSIMHCSLTYVLLMVCLGFDLGLRAFAIGTGGQLVDIFCIFIALIRQQRQIQRLLDQQMLERQRDLEMLAASEEAADQLRNQSKEVVLQSATASHDLLQLLASMRFQLATRSSDDPIIHQLKDTLSHADTMLRDRLQLNRTTYQRLQEVVSATYLIHNIVAGHRNAFQEKGLELKVNVIEAKVACQHLSVRRILDNLLQNSLRYTQNGKVLITGRPRKTGYLIQIRDTGPGIAPDKLTQMSQPFSGASDTVGSYGLGLYIVQALCRETGYRFWIESERGKGTCCSLFIPSS